MKIKIEVETDYNIGDMVYAISEKHIYNNLYRNETAWVVETMDWDNRKITPFEITERIIRQRKDESYCLYEVNNSLYNESDIFMELDLALEECNKRNIKA